MAEDGSADHIVETFGRQVIMEAVYFCEFDVGDDWRRFLKLVIKNSGSDRTFTPQYVGKVFSPQAASAPSSRIDSPGRTWKECRPVSARQRSLKDEVLGCRSQ